VDGLVSDEIIYEQTEVLNDHYNDLGYSFTVGSIDSAVNADGIMLRIATSLKLGSGAMMINT